MKKNVCPVKVGEEHTVDVIGQGAKGDGIAKIAGFVIFVPQTKPGERVRVEITSVTEKFAFGKVLDALPESTEF